MVSEVVIEIIVCLDYYGCVIFVIRVFRDIEIFMLLYVGFKNVDFEGNVLG